MIKKSLIYYLSIFLIISINCEKKPSKVGEQSKMNIQREIFGKTPEGEEIYLYTFTNANGVKAKISNFGAILVSLEVQDRNGKLEDITLGYDNLEGYINDKVYFGATIGRYADLIPKGKIKIFGVEYNLTLNDGENHLHGGKKGFNKVVWKPEEFKLENAVGVKLSYLSKDGEEGYPGNLSVSVMYLLTNDNELVINYEGQTDKNTVINLTHHSYFNLTGKGTVDILEHELMLSADKFLPLGEDNSPTGEMRDVKGTAMDFTDPKKIGSRIKEMGMGYDHCYVLNNGGGRLSFAGRVFEPISGRVMEVHTTEPGVLFYTGNYLDNVKGKSGNIYNKHYGFCLETQHFPNSPNRPNFPPVILNPAVRYISTTVYKFNTK